MNEKIGFNLMGDPAELASYRGWSEEINRDLLLVLKDQEADLARIFAGYGAEY